MAEIKSGFEVGIERQAQEVFLSLKARGKLTHADYAAMNLELESVLCEIEHPQIKALVDITELKGWELHAAWDDFKFGLEHGKEFSKIAIVGNKNWQELSAKVGTWFIAGEIEFFDSMENAKNWL